MTTYELSPTSKIKITARSPLHSTHATCSRVEGQFVAQLPEGVPAGDVTGWAEVEVKAFKSGNRLLEFNTLRHIGAKRFPRARFEISSVEVTNDTVPVTVRVKGGMEFHGTHVEISAEPTVVVEDGKVTVEGSWTLRQSDFGLATPRLAVLKVDDDIKVKFRLVAEAAPR